MSESQVAPKGCEDKVQAGTTQQPPLLNLALLQIPNESSEGN